MSAIDQVFDLPPIFEFHATDGNVFKVWVDGTVRGFPPGYKVNRIPEHLAQIPHHGTIGDGDKDWPFGKHQNDSEIGGKE